MREHDPFTIAYLGVTTKVIPIVKTNGDMQYIILLPTRRVVIETEFDEDQIDYWKEVPGGRTQLAEELGELIERHE